MPSAYRWVILGVCVFPFMQAHLHRLGFAPLIPTVIGELGIGYTGVGAIQSAYFWTYSLAQLPLGMLADRWGGRRVMLVFVTLIGIGAVVFAGSRGYGTALLGRAIVGLGAASAFAPGMRLITQWFAPAERGRATGLFTGGGALGGTLGLLVVPWLAERWGWRGTYAATAVPVLVAVALIAVLVPRNEPTASPSARPSAGALRRVLATPKMWPCNVTVLFAFGVYFGILTFLPAFFVERLALSQAEAGALTSLIPAATIVSWPMAGAVSDWLGLRKPVYLVSQVAGVLICLAFGLLVPGLSITGVSVLALVSGILFGGLITSYVMVVDLFPAEEAGTASGVVNTAGFLGAVAVPIVLGWTVDLTGRFSDAFVVAGGLQFLGLVAALLIQEPRRPQAAPA